MSHPQAGHTYQVEKDGILVGFFQWFLGPPPTYVLQDVDGEIIYQGPYDPEDPVSTLTNGTTAEVCGDVVTDPEVASIWCNCWQPGWRCRLKY